MGNHGEETWNSMGILWKSTQNISKSMGKGLKSMEHLGEMNERAPQRP